MKFSLCIPADNRLDYLIEIIECHKLQTYSSFEVCISQDVALGGLNEKISRYCLALTKDDRRFKYISANHNLGLAGNWNRFTEIVIGDYLFIPGEEYYPAGRKKALFSHFVLLKMPAFFSKNILKYLN